MKYRMKILLKEHKNSSHVFKICLPHEDSPWMKHAVVVSF